MPVNDEKTQHLVTKYVFIDTEAYRRQGLNWKDRSFEKLHEFIKQGHIKLLITEVTKLEVLARLEDELSSLSRTIDKHTTVLDQLGLIELKEKIANNDTSMDSLKQSFEKFLTKNRAIEVPQSASLDSIIFDYFSKKPPFSDKKKSEFPDAIVISSILTWCKANNASAYIVSNDPDLAACCSEGGPLFHAPTVADIISQATVSKEIHEKLADSLRDDEWLNDQLAGQIYRMDVKPERGVRSLPSDIHRIDGEVDRVDGVRIHYVNIYDQTGDTYTCEVEIEAELYLRLNIETEGKYVGFDDYDPPMSYTTHQPVYSYLMGEVIVIYDAEKNNILEYESIYVFDEIEIDYNDLDIRLFR